MWLLSRSFSSFAIAMLGCCRWWIWSTDGTTEAMEDELCAQGATTPHGDSVDFRSKLKMGTPGEQIKEEMDIAKTITTRALTA